MFDDRSSPQGSLSSTLGHLVNRVAAQQGVRMPRTLGRRRRLIRIRRLAIALCAAGLVLGAGLLLLPEPRSSVLVPSTDIGRGERLDRAGLSTRQIPESLVQGFLTDRTGLKGCVTRIRLPRDRPIPASVCSHAPELRPGQTLVSIPTSLTPGTMDPGTRATARAKGSSPVPVVLWGLETGSDGITLARVAVPASKAADLLDAASAGTVLLSPAADHAPAPKTGKRPRTSEGRALGG